MMYVCVARCFSVWLFSSELFPQKLSDENIFPTDWRRHKANESSSHRQNHWNHCAVSIQLIQLRKKDWKDVEKVPSVRLN